MSLLKRIAVRIIFPKTYVITVNGKSSSEERVNFDAPPGRHYTDASEELALERVIEYLDKNYPYWDFRMVKVGRGKYNFIYSGLREVTDAESVDRSKQD